MEYENPAAKKRRVEREKKQRWRARQTQETLDRIRKEDAERQANRREKETPDQTQARRAANLLSEANRREQETPDQTQARRAANLLSQANRREQETPDQTQARRATDLLSQANRREQETDEQTQARLADNSERRHATQERQSQAIRHEAIHFDEAQVNEHSCGALNVVCQFCGSKNFAAERPSDGKFTSCCRKGKVILEKPVDSNGIVLEYPQFLRELLSNPEHHDYRQFRDNIRSYNSALSFASMGAKVVDFRGVGPYVFKVHGQVYHKTSHLQPVNGQSRQYAQLYVVDSTQATEIRMQHPANVQCSPRILDEIDRFFRNHNRLADTYSMLREVEAKAMREAQDAGDAMPVVNLVFRRDRHSDQRRYNAPTANEIAMVFVNSDGEPPFERDIRVYPKNPDNSQQPFINMNILSPNLEPMSYPLLNPYGEAGWQPNWQCEPYPGAQVNRTRVNVTKLQYVASQTAIREGFNPRISAGRLSQQWIVDSYLQVEANNLNFIRQHQQQLRAELYQGLADHIENAAQNAGVQAGVPVILPSSFEGSPRNMKERCADAMSIFAKHGSPDLFITFTANPKWQEIKDNLQPGEQASDRPDLVSRVFKLKLKSLMQDLTVHGILGQSTAFVYTIEFQKRGLPHSHILVTLRAEDRFTSTERIDQIVSAEIPDSTENPRLREIVIRCMLHGPCGIANPHAPCMDDGKCKKTFPKQLRATTAPNVNGYPLYRRRQGITADVRGTTMDNSQVVPYNPYLLLKYNAHINVEVCTSLRAVKYIYKYIYKGFDCANMTITVGENPQLRHDELTNFINARYVSAPEAMWRLLESPMYDRSHAVMRLPVHLPNQQRITFETGREQEALEAARTGRTKLESWFQLNENDANARHLLYTDIPYNYVYVRNKWQQRQRGGNNVVARMYTVGIKDEERFYLRMLLLHVKGATSFQFLRTVDDVVYNTFKEAAFHRHLLDSDEEWDRCLQESATYQMPNQMRQTFAYICCFCMPTNAFELWNKHFRDMSLDYLRRHDEDAANNLALHDINAILKQHGLSCASIGLPAPTGNPIEAQLYDAAQEEQEAESRIRSLNRQQFEAFNKIMRAVDNEFEPSRYFYLDGPGGSGKTYLYSTLLSFVRGKGEIALPFATTGIAATLLKGGRTVHSGFKLPVPILDTSTSSMRPNSPEAETLRQAVLIIIDEISMLTKHGLRCIDQLLRDVMQIQQPFGGKAIVIGGDFRQTLPVVAKGTRVDVIECCIKSSSLWHNFTKLSLSTNMRSDGQNDHNNWLLSVGSGTLPEISGVPWNSIEIPPQMMTDDDLISTIYGQNLQHMAVEELAQRVILAPTNKDTLDMNRKIIAQLPGELRIYYSSDSIISEDPADALNYTPEFLHDQTPSGMPPHILALKPGVIIMLLRNLNPKKGLCNRTRLMIKSLQNNFITAEIVSVCNRGEIVFLPRIDLAPSDVNLPFVLKRRQFPIIPAYAMTINKSQGQTFECVGIYLNEPVFSHGQLYVALLRSKNPRQIKVFIKNNQLQGNLLNSDKRFTQNIVYREIFQTP